MITYKQVDETYFKLYDEVPMVVHVKTVLVPKHVDNGLGGIIFQEINVEPYVRNIAYDAASDFSKEFDISNWAFFMAFDGDKPVGAVTAASKTKEIRMSIRTTVSFFVEKTKSAAGFRGTPLTANRGSMDGERNMSK